MLHRRRRESPHFIPVWSLVLERGVSGASPGLHLWTAVMWEWVSSWGQKSPIGASGVNHRSCVPARTTVCVCLRYGLADSLVLPDPDWHTWHQSYASSRWIMWCSRNRQNKTTTKTRKPLFKCLKVVKNVRCRRIGESQSTWLKTQSHYVLSRKRKLNLK